MIVPRSQKAPAFRVVWMALGLLIAACSCQAAPTAEPATAQPPAISTPTQTVLPTILPSALEPTACRAGGYSSRMKCYDLVVPELHGVLNGRTLRLHVAVYEATAPERVSDPVLFLMGGPGAPGIDAFAGVGQDFSPFDGRRDVVVLDQRGTGASAPMLGCPEYRDFLKEDRTKDRSSAESTTLALDAYRACHDRLVSEGVDLSAYTNAEIAADVEDLRSALGVERWNLFGWSYGTRIALTIMRDYPQGVRSVVLDSVYPPRVDPQVELARNTQTTLRRLFDRCAADARCNEAFPQLEKVFYELLDELDANPVVAAGTIVTGDRFLDLVMSLLFDPYAIYQLPKLIYDAHNGNNTLLISKALYVFGDDDSFAEGMELSVDCGDEIRFISPSAMATGAAGVDPHLVDYLEGDAQLYFGTCAFWGAREAPAIETAPVVSNIPALLLAGDIDPFTPPEWARLTATTLSQSQVAEFPGLGHGLFLADFMTNSCVSQLVDDFLDDPSAALDTKCVDEFSAQPPGFVTK